MLIVYRLADGHETSTEGARLVRLDLAPDDPIPADALWIDLVAPTREDDRKVEGYIGVSIPTREDMDDIEPSELLYTENGARYLTARLVFRADTGEPGMAGVTFILKANRLITVRYDEPKAFAMFANRAARPGGCGRSAEDVLAGLFETIIDRAAEVLQVTGERINALSRTVFETGSDPSRRNSELQSVLQSLGRQGDLVSKSRESLVSMERVLLFLSVAYRTAKVSIELREQVRSTLRDLQSLEEHASFLSSKIQFLLDATLGLVNLEQNNIIKLFSVMAVVFMPPTLIASVYGMNFKFMPELDWHLGYPMAMGMMVVAAIAPYLFFRWKKWL